jgi:hypothetical protein
MNTKRILYRFWIIATAIWSVVWIWQFKLPCLVSLSLFVWWDNQFCGILSPDDAEHSGAVLLTVFVVGIGIPVLLWLLGSAIHWALKRG